MSRRAAIILVSGLLAFLAFAAWFDLSGRGRPSTDQGSNGAATEVPADAPPVTTPSPADDPVVEANRAERQGAAWVPRGVVDKNGNPLKLGHAVPGAFEPIEVGTSVQAAVNAGYMERDPKREQACEGTFWKWKGQLAEGLDVIVGADQRITALGMSKPGLETAEGISIGNSYAAVDRTYGDRLEGPVRMDYGQAGVFLRQGDNWIGIGFDNEAGQLADDSHVAFIEVSQGTRPGLLRDGC
jgi:hypothetical protein